MKPLWAIEPLAFQAFMHNKLMEVKAGMLAENPCHKTAGAIDDARRGGLPVDRNGSMAIVSLTGPMMKNPGWLRYFGFASSRDVRSAVQAAVADDAVDTILMRIDTPGGEVDGTMELAEEVRKAGKVKRVTAQVDGMAASAGYWVASQASSIVAGRMDMVGSIGVRMMLYDFSAMFQEAGIRAIPIDTGPFKSAGAQGTEVTEAQEAYFQGLVDDTFSQFAMAVQTGRGMSADAFDKVGDGRVFSAPEALQLGLIDRIQGIDETLSNFRQQATRKARLALSMTA